MTVTHDAVPAPPHVTAPIRPTVTQWQVRYWATGITTVLFVLMCVVVSFRVESNGNSGEDSAQSAPQQSAAEEMAIRSGLSDAIGLFGVFGGLVFVNVAMYARKPEAPL